MKKATVMRAALIILTVLRANEDVYANPYHTATQNCGIQDLTSTVTPSVDVEPTTTPALDLDGSCYCLDIYDPVFASNGVEYPNECRFNCAKRENNDIYIIS